MTPAPDDSTEIIWIFTGGLFPALALALAGAIWAWHVPPAAKAHVRAWAGCLWRRRFARCGAAEDRRAACGEWHVRRAAHRSVAHEVGRRAAVELVKAKTGWPL